MYPSSPTRTKNRPGWMSKYVKTVEFWIIKCRYTVAFLYAHRTLKIVEMPSNDIQSSKVLSQNLLNYKGFNYSRQFEWEVLVAWKRRSHIESINYIHFLKNTTKFCAYFRKQAIKTPTGHAISLPPECSTREFNLSRNDKKLPKHIVIRKDQGAYQRASAIAWYK